MKETQLYFCSPYVSILSFVLAHSRWFFHGNFRYYIEVSKMMRKGKGKVKEDEQTVETQMEGISSAHSWIKSNTMLRPTKLGKKKGGGGGGDGTDDEDDDEADIMIMLTSDNPNTAGNDVRSDRETTGAQC